MKSLLDLNAVFLVNARLPRDVRFYGCEGSNQEVSLYLSHDSIGEALVSTLLSNLPETTREG